MSPSNIETQNASLDRIKQEISHLEEQEKQLRKTLNLADGEPLPDVTMTPELAAMLAQSKANAAKAGADRAAKTLQ
ncbi:MAG: hypothetical protein IJS54_06015 [Desulfovibrio sp.]|nr:hypothetical protein [Desulfovibrio sp.]